MVAYVRELQVSKLPAGARNRLVQCISGHAVPRPIWAQPVEPDGRWKFLLIAGLVALAVMALLAGTAPLALPWMAGWALAALPLCVGAALWWRQRRIAGRLPFPVGKYLFASVLIDASDGVCRIYDLDCLTGMRVAGVFGKGGAQEAELQLVFGREVEGLRAPAKAAAERVLHNLEAARNTLAECMAAQVWENVQALDPLYEARYGGAWEQMTAPADVRWSSLAVATTGRFSFPPAVLGTGLAAALLLAPALWWADNFVRDELAFSSAQSAGTAAAFKHYLARGDSRHATEVIGGQLPAAEWRAAQAKKSVQAVWAFLAKYPNSSFVEQARAKVHAQYGEAIEHAKSEAEPAAREPLVRLLRWLEEHHTSAVQVRFGGSSEANLSRIDDLVRFYQREWRQRYPGTEYPPIAPSFSRETVRRREDALLRMVREGFEKMIPVELLEFERGGGFSGKPVGFEQPALTVQWVAELPKQTENEAVETADGKLYLQLAFQYEVNLVVPGEPPLNFQTEISPAKYVPASAASRSLYDAMSDLAFDELHQNVAAKFFPRHLPARTADRREPKAMTPADPNELVSSATGFCISPGGYLVTAQHFTKSARAFKVVTKAGLVPADLLGQDEVNDIAVLKIRGGFPVALGIRPSDSARLGETVATIGFPNITVQGQEPKVTDGKISSLAGMRDDPAMFQVSVQVQPGNSGGPLVDQHGNVLGIIVARLASPTSQNVNYAVKSSLLLTLLRSIPQVTGTPPAATGELPKFEDMVERVKQATVLIEGFGSAR